MDLPLLESILTSIGVFSIVTDDLAMYCVRHQTVTPYSLLELICITHGKLMINQTYRSSVLYGDFTQMFGLEWVKTIGSSIRKFKINYILEWIKDNKFTKDDREWVSGIVHSFAHSEFDEVLGGPTKKELPKFLDLQISKKRLVLARLLEFMLDTNQVVTFEEMDRLRTTRDRRIIFYSMDISSRVTYDSNEHMAIPHIRIRDHDNKIYCVTASGRPNCIITPEEYTLYSVNRQYPYQREEEGESIFVDKEGPIINYQTTSLGDVFNAIGKSEFKKSLLTLLSVFKISSLLSSFCDRIDPTGYVKNILYTMDELFKITGGLSALKDIVERLFLEILPAIWYMDSTYIKPELFSTRLDIIYDAIVAGKTHNEVVMRKVVTEWDPEFNSGNTDVMLAFHQTLCKMKKFVTSSSTNHLTNVMRTIIYDLTIVEQQTANWLAMANVRFEPMCIGIWGEAGIGKTTLMTDIQYEIGAILKLPSYTDAMSGKQKFESIAVLTGGVKFDENINNTTATVAFDDMGLISNEFQEPGAANLAVKFLQCQGSVPFSLNKANIEEKKGSFWNNTLTFVTSNMKTFGLNSQVQDEGAWTRRIHVIIHPYYDGDASDRTNLRYSANIINYGLNTREQLNSLTVQELMKVLRIVAKRYMDYRELRLQRTFAICKVCRELPHNCQCNTVLSTVSSLSNNSALWMKPIEIERSSAVNILKMIVFEETLSYCLLTLFLFYSISWFYAVLILGIIREVLECVYGKEFNYFRYFVMSISLIYYPLSILVHMIFNAPLFVWKLKLEWDLPNFIERKVETCGNILSSIVYRQFVPQWYINWRLSNVAKMNYRDLLYSKAFVGSSTLIVGGLAIKTFYDKYYNLTTVETALGQTASDEDKKATFSLDQQIGGTPELVQHGKTNNNAWKTPGNFIYRKAGGGVSRKLKSCSLELTIYNNAVTPMIPISKMKGFLANNCLYTVKHAFKDCSVGAIGYNFPGQNPQDGFVLTYDLNSTSILKGNDFISIPIFSDRKMLTIRWNYIPDITDVLYVDGQETKIIIGTKVEGHHFMYILDCEGGYGKSGTHVAIIKSKGYDVQNEVVGIITGMATGGPYKGKAMMQVLNVPTDDLPVVDDKLDSEMMETDYKHSSDDVNIYLGPEYKYLPAFSTPENVIERLYTRYGIKIKQGIAPHSVLGHLKRLNESGDIDGVIGEHVGWIDRPPPPNKSKFYKTKFYDKAKDIADVSQYTIPNMTKGVVDGEYQDSLLACVRQMNSSGVIHDESPFWSATELVTGYIYGKMSIRLDEWEPYDTKTIILGDSKTTAMNREAAKGYPYSGMKDDWIFGDFEKPYLSKEICDDIAQTIQEMDDFNYPPLNISTTSLKDEIISVDKNNAKQVRVFFGGNTPFLILCRAYLGKLMSIFVDMRDQLFPKIGMNAISKEFHQMVEKMYIAIHGNLDGFTTRKCWIDGDFSKYDKLLLVLKFGIHVLWWLGRRAKYFRKSRKQMNRLRLILTALCEYLVFLGNDLFIMRDKLPSGVWATALINCICEMIIEVIMFYFLWFIHMGFSHAADFVSIGYYRYKIYFFKLVTLANYGDDNIKCIHVSTYEFYNHDAIMLFAKWIHMGITPARKHEGTIKLKPITDVLFLKRVFTWNTHLNRLVGALEISSIAKMLAFSDTKHVESWEHSVMITARRELSFHGQEIYDKFCKNFDINMTWIETLDEIESGDWKYQDCLVIPINTDEDFYFQCVQNQGTLKQYGKE